jgi:hypothetical protein
MAPLVSFGINLQYPLMKGSRVASYLVNNLYLHSLSSRCVLGRVFCIQDLVTVFCIQDFCSHKLLDIWFNFSLIMISQEFFINIGYFLQIFLRLSRLHKRVMVFKQFVIVVCSHI